MFEAPIDGEVEAWTAKGVALQVEEKNALRTAELSKTPMRAKI
jgi:hypothetical protein